MNTPEIPAAPSSPEGDSVAPETTSLAAKLVNIFVQPGEVFDEVRASKAKVVNWLVPSLLSALMGIVFTFVVFSQDTVIQQMRDAQTKAMDQKVTDGKLTRQQADAAAAATERFMTPTLIKAFGSVGAVFGTFAALFLFALLFWLVGRFALKAELSYIKSLEVVALVGMIGVLGTVVTMLIVVAMGSLHMNPGPVLLVQQFDPANRLHRALAGLNLATIWYFGVLATGLSRVTGRSWLTAAPWVFVPWIVLHGGWILLGWGG